MTNDFADGLPGLEDRLTESLQRHAGELCGSAGAGAPPGSLRAVIQRSRQRRRARRQMTGALVAISAVLASATALGVRDRRTEPVADNRAPESNGKTPGTQPGSTASPNLDLISALQDVDSCETLLDWI